MDEKEAERLRALARTPYTDEEKQALHEIHQIVARNANELADVITELLDHLLTCTHAEHRRECAKGAATSMANLSNCMRTAGWVEQALSKGRTIVEPLEMLANLKEVEAATKAVIEQQEAREAAMAKPIGPEEQPAQTPAEQTADFDPALVARVTHVPSGTKQ